MKTVPNVDVLVTVRGKYWHEAIGSTCPILARSDPRNVFTVTLGSPASNARKPCPECGPTEYEPEPRAALAYEQPW
jgi:hypothetical protein